MKGIELLRNICFTLCLALGAVAFAEEPPAEPVRVDINQAGANELSEVLDGVGVIKAEAIIRYREAHGGFRSAEELANVKGIGMAIVDRNMTRIVVSED